MTEQTECRWSWCKPDKPGLWWWCHMLKTSQPNNDRKTLVDVESVGHQVEGWWAYIGPIPPEPLPPKKKVTQTLWMVPKKMWAGGTVEELWFSADWLSHDDTIPPGSIETVQKREVEQ